MDITLHITTEDVGYRKAGDIILVYPRDRCPGAPNPNGRLVFVHVRGAPQAAMSAYEALARPVMDEATVGEGGLPYIILHASAWHFVRANATQVGLNALAADRQVTVTWARAKELICNRVTGQLLTDGDILNG